MPVTIDATGSSSIALPAATAVRVRRSKLNVLDGHASVFTGALRTESHTALARRVVFLQGYRGHRWRTLARARTRANGRFRLSFVPHRLGSELVRVSFPGDPFDRPVLRRLGRLTVYRLAGASWYGGGGGLACGGELTSSTLGVANKTLPCGTMVTLHYGGHTLRVPVVDRGPYVAGRDFDLTEATRAALGFGDTGDVWSTR
ncbi:MAG TPA: RlpA-like double-psi beta-barrel domain-containing protein [Solirubrobacteraceae bacterium]|nr:RlpA-like double-psi beta-barrel domain-containing protein [Solirubrobacteraceae bacterium]